MAGSCLRLFYALAVIAGLFIGGNEAVCISKTYRPTTSYQYVRKYAYANNEDCNFYFLPYSSYSSSLYFLEIQWYYNPAFSVKGEMPNCARDYVEVFLTGYDVISYSPSVYLFRSTPLTSRSGPLLHPERT